MSQRPPIKYAMLGAAGGAAVGLVVVFLVWLFLPPAKVPVAPEAAGTPVASSPEPVTTPVAPSPSSPTGGEPVRVASKSRQELQAEIYGKLRKIGLALHVHHDRFQTFAPPMAMPGDDKATRLSWRVHILPFLDQKPLYEQFYLDEPWDSQHNKKLLDKMPDVFRIGDSPEPVTRFRVFTGDRVVFGPGKFATIAGTSDGVSNTIHVVVTGPDREVPWTKPDELPLDVQNPVAAFGTLPDGVFDCLMGDGQSLTLPADVLPEIVVALATPAGGELVDAGSLRRGIGVKTRSNKATAPESTANTSGPTVSAATKTDPGKPKLVKPTERPNLKETLQKMERIGWAFGTYYDKNSRFPLAGDPDSFKPDQRPKLSWRVHLLPYLQQKPLYDSFHLDEPWDSPHNLTLLDQMPDMYRSDSSELNVTRLQVLSGERMLFGKGFHSTREVTDGLGNTLLVVVTGWDRAVLWTKPEDITFDPNAPLAALGSYQPDPIFGVSAGFTSVMLPSDIDSKTFSALATPAGGEIVDGRRYHKKWHELTEGAPAAAADRAKSDGQMKKLKDIGLALHRYHDAHGQFPLIDNQNYKDRFDAQGRPHLSWRVHLLPFLDQLPLYQQFKPKEPWDSPSNRPLLDKMPDVFRDEDDSPTSTTTRFVVMTGPETPFASKGGPRIRDFKDGTSTTILVVRVGKNKAVPWTKPDDAVFNPAAPLDALGSLGSEELMFVTPDGAVKRLKPTLPAAVFKALVTPAGRESIDSSALESNDFAAALKSSSTPKQAVSKTTEANTQPILARATAAGRRGDWNNATMEFARYFELRPVNQMTEGEQYYAYQYATLLARGGDKLKYESFCLEVLQWPKNVNHPTLAERTAKVCMLRPTSDEVLSRAARLADLASEYNNGEFVPYYEFAAALAAYRQGKYDQAIEWTKKSLKDNQIKADYVWYLIAMNHTLQAMTQQQLKDQENAQRSLHAADQIIKEKLPKLGSGDLGVSWFDWLMCDLLRQEAGALVAK